MQSFHQRYYSFRVDANALGGSLEEPLPKIIPTVAPVSLPAVGGFATTRECPAWSTVRTVRFRY